MGLITSTGLFKYLPPNPKITSTSSPTGDLGQVISIFGEDLDYVDTLSFAGENLNFALIDATQQMQFLVPSNPDTGKLIIASNTFEITGQNNLPFLPIFTFEDFNPKDGSEGGIVNITGKVLTSISTGSISASPILDDIDYYFSGERNTFHIPMSRVSGLENTQIFLAQNFNTNSEINEFKLLKVNPFSIVSGKSLAVEYAVDTSLNQKYYENHLLSMSGVIAPNLQAFKTLLPSGSGSYTINIPSGLNNTGYAVFYSLIQSGAGHKDSYIKNKTTGSFDIAIPNTLNYPVDLNVLLINSTLSGFVYDSGFFEKGSVNISANYSTQKIYFDQELSRVDTNLYPPFLFTSIEEIPGVDIGGAYSSVNIFGLNKDYFSLAIPNAVSSNTFRLNYLTIFNSGTNLSTFVYDGDRSYYKKIYLLTGSESNFQEEIPLQNFTINNKNSISFEIPSTDYYINGKIKLTNSTGISKDSGSTFREVPTPLVVLPTSGNRGSNIAIAGKSFKKPILIDSPYQYESCFVRFRYADNIYPANQSTFESSFRIINKNLLSGSIPLSNIPTGRYAIQMMSEEGGLYE